MVDVVNTFCGVAIQVASDLSENRFARVNILIERGGDGIKTVDRAVGREIEGMHDFVDVSQRDSSLSKTIRDGADREVAAMFFPVEAFFGGGGDQLTAN